MTYDQAVRVAESYRDRVWEASVYDDRHGTNRKEALIEEFFSLPEIVKQVLNDIED